MLKITPFLWFDNQAEEAAKFYTSIFKNSKVVQVSHYGDAGPRPKGSVMTVAFELEGQQFTALNGGPLFKFNEAISFVVDCKSQEEVDYMWARLTDGGEEGMCGWLKDKFGLSWQIVPKQMGDLLGSPDRKKSMAATNAMLKMKKIVISDLQEAFDRA